MLIRPYARCNAHCGTDVRIDGGVSTQARPLPVPQFNRSQLDPLATPTSFRIFLVVVARGYIFFFPPLSPPSNWSATHSRTHTSVLGVPSEAPPVIRPHSEHLIERSLPSSFFLFREVGLHKRQDTLNVRKRSYRPEGRIGG